MSHTKGNDLVGSNSGPPQSPANPPQSPSTIDSELRYDPQGAEKAITTMKLADVRKKHPSLDKEVTKLMAQEANKARKDLLLKLKQVPPIDWLDANASIDQWLAELEAKILAEKGKV